MTARQDYVDSLNRYVEMNDEYNAVLAQMKALGGLKLTIEDVDRLDQLWDEVEEAHRDFMDKRRAWVASGED